MLDTTDATTENGETMALDILVTTPRLTHDPFARDFIEHLRKRAAAIGLEQATLYYDFPSYADYETVTHKPDALLVSPHHGIVAICLVDGQLSLTSDNRNTLDVDDSLAQFCSIAIGRLLKSKSLRRDVSSLKFKIRPVILVRDVKSDSAKETQSSIAKSLDGFEELLKQFHNEQSEPLTINELSEVRSVLEGAKALTRAQKRIVTPEQKDRAVSALAALEAEIANFDQKQRRAALVTMEGPQRIRGLAGSGKTVILAMKAAHLHLTNPTDQILVTFYTKSLRGTLKTMISRFFRHYKDEDPNWEKIHIRHGWGGKRSEGVYADASRRAGRTPTNLADAKRLFPTQDPFDAICKDLASSGTVQPFYNQLLIDEGQDFPSGFYELCFALCQGGRDRKSIVWAYDELQNIMNVKIRSPEELFGMDVDGQPKISLERATTQTTPPPGAKNDTVLSKCYRNQREILMAAHALGFGLYGGIVQLLESKEHWEDVGYKVLSGPTTTGSQVEIERPQENSPINIQTPSDIKLIETLNATNFRAELDWITSSITSFIGNGLQPEDIVVIALDDMNAKQYFIALSERLASLGIRSNNIIADPYTEPPFQMAGHVTLSTVYRAKGNEAAVVFACGVDAIPLKTRSGRNRLFTAFTRTKAWLRVSGSNGSTSQIIEEIERASALHPRFKFQMPDLGHVEFIQRDLGQKAAQAKQIRAKAIAEMKRAGLTEEEIEQSMKGDWLE